jgi:hypothetical protein
MGSAVCQRILFRQLCRVIPCLARSILANGVAVRGLGRDGNCRECRDCGGDIFFRVSRQKIHLEKPPRIFEMAMAGLPSVSKSPQDMQYASGRDPAMKKTCSAFA